MSYVFTEPLAGRVYLVTGGGSGIGASIASQLAQLGARVAVAGRRQDRLDQTVAHIAELGGQADAYPLDVRDPDQVTGTVAGIAEQSGRIDGLVNNAAGNFVCPAEDLSANGWRSVIDIVLNGTWNCTSAVGRHMINARRPGVILNVIATYAWTGHPGTVHSATAKAGVLTMTRTLAVEWARHGIRLNCIAPGPTSTAGAGAALWGTDEERERVLASVPMRRFADPDEIAGLAAFLMSDQASYVTGEVLTADGGQALGKQIYGPAVVPAPAENAP
ncbi:2,4-dienoyl-CoA reductase [Actinomadura sp. LD22]|uniref:2,4-dienoyl-CoA reductase n=1 Tax=Actinomadura physcomitrii TaxID=2650748 RepID=A0A6I4MI47_9ACTN|nr:2,4-dienoyl-CoA reductase [Actinomadura physcomitrii]MWA05413.1 2,4-dienoyl-CoA reductase [Actinomadura physcomitrii]